MWKKKHITTFKHQKLTADIYPPGASYSAIKLNKKYFKVADAPLKIVQSGF